MSAAGEAQAGTARRRAIVPGRRVVIDHSQAIQGADT